MPISLAMARRVTPAVPSAAICALATDLISSAVAWRTRSRLGNRSAVSVMLTAYGRVNVVNNSEVCSDRERDDGRPSRGHGSERRDRGRPGARAGPAGEGGGG